MGSKVVLECKQRLNELGERNKVTVKWVPGHEGILGNEKADMLARLGANKSFIGPEPRFGIAKTTRKRLVCDWLKNQHSKAWTRYEGARHTKIFHRNPSKETRLALLILGRQDIKKVVEVVTNHCSLNKYLYDINCLEDPRCLCNLNDETGCHIVADCPRYRFIRKRVLGKPEFHVSELHCIPLADLAMFLKQIKRLP